MDKVLIVDGDKKHLQAVSDGLRKLNQFDVLTAADGESALALIKNESISVFVTDLSTPKVDGLDLLAFVSRERPHTPCIVMTSYGKPWFKERTDQHDVLYHIEKPADLGALASAIFVGLNLNDEGLSFKGFSMSSFLPLIELEQRTCRLEVESTGKGKGYLYFFKGTLIDAHFNDLNGENAARAMSRWSNVKFKFTELPRRRTSKRVKTELMEMAGASWLRDDTPLEETSSETGPAARPHEADDAPAALEKAEPRPKQPAAPSKALQRAAAKGLERYAPELRAINGYRAVGLFDAQGGLLAVDATDADVHLEALGAQFLSTFEFSRQSLLTGGLDACQQMTVHTDSCVVLITRSEQPAYQPIFVISVLQADGNWYFMKVKLEKILPQLLAD
jgi:CheY-like chemotaxis protein